MSENALGGLSDQLTFLASHDNLKLNQNAGAKGAPTVSDLTDTPQTLEEQGNDACGTHGSPRGDICGMEKSRTVSSAACHQTPSLANDDDLNQSIAEQENTASDLSDIDDTHLETLQETSDDTIANTHDSHRCRESHPKYRFNLYHFCNCIPSLVFVISKYTLSSRGESFTVNKYDLSMGVIQFILYLIGRYETCPPPKLRWFLDTDWGYILKLGIKTASAIRSHYDPFTFWICLLMGIGSAHSVISFVWSYSSLSLSHDHDARKLLLVNGFGIISAASSATLSLEVPINEHRPYYGDAITSAYIIIMMATAMLAAIALPSEWIIDLPPVAKWVFSVSPGYGLMLDAFCGTLLVTRLKPGFRSDRIQIIALLVDNISGLISFCAIAIATKPQMPRDMDVVPFILSIIMLAIFALRLFRLVVPVKMILKGLRQFLRVVVA